MKKEIPVGATHYADDGCGGTLYYRKILGEWCFYVSLENGWYASLDAKVKKDFYPIPLNKD